MKNREIWLDWKAVQRLTRWRKRTIQSRSQNGQLRSRASTKRGRNGKPVREYAASALPAEAQMLLAKSRMAEVQLSELPMAIVPHADSHVDKQIGLFSLPPAISEDQRLALTREQNEIAQRRLEMLAPLLEFSRKSNGHRPVCHLPDGRDIRSREELVEYIAQQRGVSRASLWRWYCHWKEHGYSGLADSVRRDKGSSRFFDAHPLVAEFIQAKYLGERLSVRQVHEAVLREWKDPENSPPHYNTIRAYLNALPKPITIMAREGEREFHERCAPFLITDFKSVRPNQIWVSDHVVHDVFVRNDGFFAGRPRDAAIRPWMTAIIDMRSRKCVGAVWCATPSSHSISSALRAAITACGIPETFYIDNGKDFESVGRVDFSPEASGVLARLGIEPQYCIPKHPQSKLIESWFATVHKRFDTLWKPFYCGASPAVRPEDCDLALKEHAKLQKLGRPQSSPLPTAGEFVSIAREWIEEFNATHPHSGRGMDGKTPDEIYGELLPEEKRAKLKPGDMLQELFWERDRRRVLEGGCVQIFNQRYEPADADSGARLFMEIEREIFIACDPANLGEALALDLDGRFLGRLRCQKLIARGPLSRDDVREGMRKQRLVRRVVRDYIDSVASGYGTELDQFRKRVPQRDERLRLPGPPEVLLPRKAVNDMVHVADIARAFLEDE